MVSSLCLTLVHVGALGSMYVEFGFEWAGLKLRLGCAVGLIASLNSCRDSMFEPFDLFSLFSSVRLLSILLMCVFSISVYNTVM